MTTITIKNSKNFSLETLTKLLNSLDIEVVKIVDEDEALPVEHMESIQKGLNQFELGLGKSNSEVHKKAREICSK